MPDPVSTSKDARQRVLRSLSQRLGHEFDNLAILDRALTHASTGNEGKANYERLEFLGDSFLNFAVADALFRRDPEIPEGALTETRAALVSRRPLAAIARSLGLTAYLETGKGLREAELQSERILADLVEAVLGAIYLDGGVDAAHAFVKAHVLENDAAILGVKHSVDNKTSLLHYCQRHGLGQPTYELVETSGMPHEQHFHVRACLPDGRTAPGSGSNKRSAEKDAAATMLQELRTAPRPETN